jgi:hypothetical protein
MYLFRKLGLFLTNLSLYKHNIVPSLIELTDSENTLVYLSWYRINYSCKEFYRTGPINETQLAIY